MRRVLPVPLVFLLSACVGCGSSPTSAPVTWPTRPNPPITINLKPDGATGDGKESAKEPKSDSPAPTDPKK